MYPNMEHVGNNIYKLPGKNRPINITPLENDCSLCGKNNVKIVGVNT